MERPGQLETKTSVFLRLEDPKQRPFQSFISGLATSASGNPLLVHEDEIELVRGSFGLHVDGKISISVGCGQHSGADF